MKCRKVAQELPAYLANELSERARSRVERHLKHCAVCTDELRALERTDQLLGTLGEIEPRRDLVGLVMQRIEREQESIPAFKRFLIALNERRPRLQYAAANILLVLALGIMVYNYQARHRAKPTDDRSANDAGYQIPMTERDVEKLNRDMERARAGEPPLDEGFYPERLTEALPVDATIILRPGPDGTLVIEPGSEAAGQSPGE
jgi:hypothetical protein